MQVAQTNVQLYNQLREQGRPLDGLVAVHRAYEFLTTMYPGYYQADGKPFVAHGVGVASILAGLDQPPEMLAVALLHNVYGNADFGDGLGPGATPTRRQLVREAVGTRVEELLARLADSRLVSREIAGVRSRLPELDDDERSLLLVDLADHLEKYVDLGVLYYGENDWVLGASGRIGDDFVALARELGQPRLAESFTAAFDEAAAQAHTIPAELRASDGRRYLRLTPPRSHRRRLRLTLGALARRVRGRLRVRTQLRRLRRVTAAQFRA
jgi:hypothetical protein